METWRHDLFSLSLFIQISEARSITRAAEQMNVATSAASRPSGGRGRAAAANS
ncbi:LysR family transcriptional regulator [Aurantimonas sp. E1-2-R+4]|uniref:LysR family transcriptional regulator n=1 Tax=Aurantimonas sp. E1-2-R+4 TaxID=3113714 RepID=UPI003FA583BC